MFEPKKAHLDSREDFERNINILVESIINGKVKFSDRSAIESLNRVCKLPNSRVDLHTINESVRNMSNMASNFEHMEKIQKKYEEK